MHRQKGYYDMAKVFRPSTRESSILSKIESSKEYERRRQINATRDCLDALANAIAMKLVEEKLVETTNKNSLEEQLVKSIGKLSHADDFEIDYQVAPVRNIVTAPNVVALYLTAFVIEQVVKHKDVVDVFGSDEDIYYCINKQVNKFITT
jgi:hypothetical protein